MPQCRMATPACVASRVGIIKRNTRYTVMHLAVISLVLLEEASVEGCSGTLSSQLNFPGIV